MAPPTCNRAAIQEEEDAATDTDSVQDVVTESFSSVKAAIKQESTGSPSNSPRPSKRRRVASAESDSNPEATYIKPKVGVHQAKHEIKSKAKKPERRKLLNEESIRSRIALIGFDVFPIPVDAALASLTATRYFLSSFFGGGPQATFSRTSKDHRNPKKREIMALKTEWNPHAPLIPGAPGLYFDDAECPDYFADPHRRLTVFIHVEGSQWLYVGEYKWDKLFSFRWMNGCPLTRRVRYSWGWSIRAAIALRERLGREPTRDDFENARSAKEEFLDITPEQIQEEFDVGREHIQIWTMKCLGYDEEIPNTIAAHSAGWEAARTARLAESRKTARQENGEASRAKTKVAKEKTTTSSKRGTKSEASLNVHTPKKEERKTDIPHLRPKHGRARTSTPTTSKKRKWALVESEGSGSDNPGNDSDDDYVPS